MKEGKQCKNTKKNEFRILLIAIQYIQYISDITYT